jgi:hypothetical protein
MPGDVRDDPEWAAFGDLVLEAEERHYWITWAWNAWQVYACAEHGGHWWYLTVSPDDGVQFGCEHCPATADELEPYGAEMLSGRFEAAPGDVIELDGSGGVRVNGKAHPGPAPRARLARPGGPRRSLRHLVRPRVRRAMRGRDLAGTGPTNRLGPRLNAGGISPADCRAAQASLRSAATAPRALPGRHSPR